MSEAQKYADNLTDLIDGDSADELGQALLECRNFLNRIRGQLFVICKEEEVVGLMPVAVCSDAVEAMEVARDLAGQVKIDIIEEGTRVRIEPMVKRLCVIQCDSRL